MKRLNETGSMIFILFCVLCSQRQPFRFLFYSAIFILKKATRILSTTRSMILTNCTLRSKQNTWRRTTLFFPIFNIHPSDLSYVCINKRLSAGWWKQKNKIPSWNPRIPSQNQVNYDGFSKAHFRPKVFMFCLISPQKHMLWVLIMGASARLF